MNCDSDRTMPGGEAVVRAASLGGKYDTKPMIHWIQLSRSSAVTCCLLLASCAARSRERAPNEFAARIYASMQNFSPTYTSRVTEKAPRGHPGDPSQETFETAEVVGLNRVPKDIRKRLSEYASILGHRVLEKEEALAILRPQRVVAQPTNNRVYECEFLFLDDKTCVRLIVRQMKEIPGLDQSVEERYAAKSALYKTEEGWKRVHLSIHKPKVMKLKTRILGP